MNSGNDVTASGTGTIDIDASGDISATSATAAKDVIIGATTAAAGTVSVTKTKAGASSIAVDGGTDVTISVTGSSGGCRHNYCWSGRRVLLICPLAQSQ